MNWILFQVTLFLPLYTILVAPWPKGLVTSQRKFSEPLKILILIFGNHVIV